MLLLVDLDGVVYRGRSAVPGVAALLAERASRGDAVIYCTNNSSRHRTEYLAQLRELGAPVRPEVIVTSARATALALAQDEPRTRVAMVLGGDGLARELRDVGIRTVAPTAHGVDASPDTLVVGIDRRFTYARLGFASQALRSGARFVVTNRDPVFPAADGLRPGTGSIVAAVEAAAGRTADLVVGKPEPRMFEVAARVAGLSLSEAVVIGDGIGTDIEAANRVGARSILMLTGVTTPDQLAAAPPGRRPTHVASDAQELRDVLERLST